MCEQEQHARCADADKTCACSCHQDFAASVREYGYRPLSKFSSARDECLYVMTLDGWANESTGNSEAPTGWFALVVNEPAELTEILQAFDGFPDVEASWTDAEIRAELTGAFIVSTDSQGFVYVEAFPTAGAAKTEYDARDAAYSAWDDQGDE
jgi:hypothetical protein